MNNFIEILRENNQILSIDYYNEVDATLYSTSLTNISRIEIEDLLKDSTFIGIARLSNEMGFVFKGRLNNLYMLK
jgi:predicted KAP-like P-loop ATPase